MTVGAARAFHCPYFGKGKPPERSAGGQIAQVQTLLSAQALIVLGQAAGSARGRARPPCSHDQTMGERYLPLGRKEGPWPVGEGPGGRGGSGALKSPERDRIRDFPESPAGVRG